MKPEDLQQSINLLSKLASDAALLSELSEEDRIALLKAAGRLSRPGRDEIRRRHKAMTRTQHKKQKIKDRTNRAATGIREARQTAIFQAPPQISSSNQKATELHTPRNCYVCKVEFKRLHHFYDSMCIPCAEFNYQKRFQTAPLHNQVALITGSRLKIGYQASLMLLRSGAHVIATTRFPIDAALRFSKEADFAQWGDRLQVHGLDLRHTPSVEIFARYIEQTTGRLDILINNAAQTVRRPPGFYSHLIATEMKSLTQFPPEVRKILRARETCKGVLDSLCLSLPATTTEKGLPITWHGNGPGVGLRASAQLSQIPYTYDDSVEPVEVFPEGKLDADLQQVDLRKNNSWRLRLHEVPAPEMLEVQLVNSVAPFVLCSKLAPLMRRHLTGQKHIVNVSAMEGKFHRFTKTDKHPHTNMAKAALNMLTLTSAKDLEKDGIYMNAVDTGWVTDEDPVNLSVAKQDMHDFHPPLDIVDGAARVCDPFFHGILTGHHWSGKFLKDYKPTDW